MITSHQPTSRTRPRRRLSILTLSVAVAVLTATGVAAGGTITGESAVPRPPVPVIDEQPPAAVSAAAPEQRPPATVTLLTGDKVRLETGPDGHQATSVTRQGDPDTGTTYSQFAWKGDRYVLPSRAVPYLGSALDLRLFNVSYLVRAGLDDANTATLPVTVTGSGTLPAVRSSRAPNGTAEIAKAEAGQLGRLLAERWRTDGSAAATLPGITRLALARPAGAPALPADPAATPAAPAAAARYHTLTLDTIDLNGDPGLGVGFIHNLDDPSLALFTLMHPGEGRKRFSVPEGTYSFEVSVFTGPATDLTETAAMVVEPELRIASDQTVTLDARGAVPYRVSVEEAPTTSVQQDLLGFVRTNASGGQVGIHPWGFTGALGLFALRLLSNPSTNNAPIQVKQTRPVTSGGLNFFGTTQIVPGTAGPPEQPRYNIVLPITGGVPASLTRHLRTAELATVTSHLYRQPAGTCSFESTVPYYNVFVPWTQTAMGLATTDSSGERTDYFYSSDPDITLWEGRRQVDCALLHGPRRIMKPGQHLEETWSKAPYAPPPAAPYVQESSIAILGGADSILDDPLATVCAACRQDDNGMVYLRPAGDSDGTHYGFPAGGASALRFYRDGALALTTDSLPSINRLTPNALLLPLLPGQSSYRLDWTQARVADPASSTRTVWDFRSSRNDPKPALSETATCSPDPGRRCSYLPLLFVRYDLPLDLGSKAPAGAPFELRFAVSHQQNQPKPAGVTTTVAASYDDGKTWSDAQPATAAGGWFTATLQHPPLDRTSGFVSIRVRARDAAGSTVEQTIVRAYGLTAQPS